MKVYFSQLSSKLNKGLSNFYLVSGDEPLQKMEAGDMIRAKAQKNGYQDRELFFAEKDFDWGSLNLNASNVSLFGDKRFLDIRVQTEKINAQGIEFINKIIKTPFEDCLFLIQVTKVDGRSSWIKKLSEQARQEMWIPVYAKNFEEMKRWLFERASRNKLTLGDGVIDLIAQYTEGNMLAAGQELEKIKSVISDSKKIVSLTEAQKVLSDSAQYTPFDFADAVIAGNTDRAMHIYDGLLVENAPLPLILWSLADQFRKMVDISQRLEQGESIESAIRGIWKIKHPIYRQAIERRFESMRWQGLLHGCYQVDLALKGNGLEEEWNELLRLIMRALGANPLRPLKR